MHPNDPDLPSVYHGNNGCPELFFDGILNVFRRHCARLQAQFYGTIGQDLQGSIDGSPTNGSVPLLQQLVNNRSVALAVAGIDRFLEAPFDQLAGLRADVGLFCQL